MFILSMKNKDLWIRNMTSATVQNFCTLITVRSIKILVGEPQILGTKLQADTGNLQEEISLVTWEVYFLTIFLHTTNFLDDNDVKNVKSPFQIVPLCHMSEPGGNQPFDMLSMCE